MWLLKFLAAVFGWIGSPGEILKNLVSAYDMHLKATTNDKQIAADLAGKEIAAQTAEGEQITRYKIASLGHPFEPDKLMGYFVAIHLGKLLVWDTVLGLGTTAPLYGWATSTEGMIVAFYFGKRGFENIAAILKAR